MSTIAAEHVTYSAGKHTILNDVSLLADRGLTSLIGPNGAGKTTLLRVLSGYLEPENGSALLNGRPVRALPARERAQQIAVVAQHARMEYDFSVLDVVLMGRTAWKPLMSDDTAEDRARARQALKDAGALEFAERPVTELSGGERQRVMIARAFCQDAGILLLDEPVSALDIRHQVGIMSAVRRYIEERDIVCVCVLHDLNLAAYFSERIILMEKGRIAADGTPAEVLKRELLETVYNTAVRVIEDEDELIVLPDLRKVTVT